MAAEASDGANDDLPEGDTLPPALELDDRPAPRTPAEPDDPLAEFSPAPKPPVRLADEGGEPIPIMLFHAGVTELCVEMIAALARDRALRPLADRAGSERRILEQLDAIAAVAAVGGGAIDPIERWWEGAAGSRDGWKTWAAVLTLGSIAGGEAAILRGLSRLPTGARDHGVAAAEALGVLAHPGAPALGRRLVRSPHPVARAVGVDVLSRAAALPLEELEVHLADVNPPVLEAALRAVERIDPPPFALAPALLPRMSFPHAAVAWRASRLLLLWGFREPHAELVRGGRLAATLGPLALELLVLRGVADDLRWMEARMPRWVITPAILSAVARFGHPRAWAFLLHFVSDEDLADPAASALETLFGPRVPAPERLQAPAWRRAIAAGPWDEATRYRRGEPWQLSTVLAECTAGRLPRDETQRRLDELGVRVPAPVRVDLGAWSPDPLRKLEALATLVRDKGRRVPPGSWT